MAKHRKFTAEFKAKVVLEILDGKRSAAEVCREYGLKPDLVSKWKATFLGNAPKLFESETADPQQARIQELERLVGQQALELEIAKKASQLLSAARSRNGL